MNSKQPHLYIIGGPNGAGKTTAAFSLLPKLLDCYEYVNADSIAAALSPFAPERTAVQAGRLMLDRIENLVEQRKDFAFETTMASRTFVPLLNQYKKDGYKISAIYFWLLNPELALQRVKHRVLNGGHYIPDDVVLRRYGRSIYNFLNLYIPIADDWTLFNNSFNMPTIVAEKKNGNDVKVGNKNEWDNFRNSK